MFGLSCSFHMFYLEYILLFSGPSNDVLISIFFWLFHVTCRILVPQPGIEPGPNSESAES